MKLETLKEFPDSTGLKVGSVVNHGLVGNAKIVAIKGPTAESVDRFGKHIKVQLSSLKSGEVKELAVTEGTWAIPKSPEEIQALMTLMSKPILAKNATKVLYKFVGDDSLFDMLGDLKDHNPESDVRDAVTDFLKKKFPKVYSKLKLKEETITNSEFKLMTEIRALIPGQVVTEAGAVLSDSMLTRMFNGFEKQLSPDARYKSFDFSSAKKCLWWITQSTDKKETQEAADKLASLMKAAGLKGWKINVVLRDESTGDVATTPWSKAKS